LREHIRRIGETYGKIQPEKVTPVNRSDISLKLRALNSLQSFEFEDGPRVLFQLALSLGEWEQGGATLLDLARFEAEEHPRIQTAILSSAIPHLDAVLTGLFTPGNRQPPQALIEEFIGLAVVAKKDGALAKLLERITDNPSGQYEGWQYSALGAFLDALDRRGMSLATYQTGAPDQRQSVQKLAGLFGQAREGCVPHAAASNPQRAIAAARLLSRGTGEQTEDLLRLAALLKPQVPPDVQQAGLAALQRDKGVKTGELLLADWKAHSPALREAVLGALLSRPAWIDTLLAAVERGQVAPTQISPAQRQKLTTHPQAALRDRATKLFAATSADRAKVIKVYAVVATLTGSATRGRELFTKNCSVCHKLKGEGREIGPDLGQVATRDTDWLLTAILDPNAAVESRYLAYTAETKAGREFTGIITAETPNNIVMKSADGTEETILRSDLKSLTGSGLSLMPEGMESALKPQDMADLLAFIRAK
jgi:putative heme-binding domain-containing protein